MASVAASRTAALVLVCSIKPSRFSARLNQITDVIERADGVGEIHLAGLELADAVERGIAGGDDVLSAVAATSSGVVSNAGTVTTGERPCFFLKFRQRTGGDWFGLRNAVTGGQDQGRHQ